MSKPKQAPALLEVYHRRRNRQRPKPDSGPPVVAAPEMEPEPPTPEYPPAPEEHTPPLVGRFRWIATEGDYVRFQLNTLGLAMVLAGALAVIALGYGLGRHQGYRAARLEQLRRSELVPAEIDEVRRQDPDATLLEDLELVESSVIEQRTSPPDTRDVAEGFIDDLNYIWIETFKSQDDALRALDYLERLGISAVIATPGGKWRLISAQGFDYQDPAAKQACLQLLQRIKHIGRQYMQDGGQYRFDAFVNKKLPDERW